MSAEYLDTCGNMRDFILKSRKYTLALLVLLIVFPLTTVQPQGGFRLPVIRYEGDELVSVADLVSKLNLNLSLDLPADRIRLYHNEHFALFAVGYSHMILDGRLYKAPIPVVRMKGEVFVPVIFAESIASRVTGRTVHRGDNFLIDGDEMPLPVKPVPVPDMAPARDRIGFIIIDAGHGGKDPGAVGRGGLREKDMTLTIARELAAYLKKNIHGVDVTMTRNRDIFLELGERTDRANGKLVQGVNGLFVSVHVNASLVPQISGFETYFLSQNPSNDEARNTAALENDVIILEEKSAKGKRYGDVDYIEAMMLTTQIQKESSMLAESIQKGLDVQVREFKSRGVRKADFFVLRGSLMPAALVEVGYITNRRESGFLRDKKYQNRLARGIGDGILGFMKQYERMIRNQQAEK